MTASADTQALPAADRTGSGTLLDVAVNVALLLALGTWWLAVEKVGGLFSRPGRGA